MAYHDPRWDGQVSSNPDGVFCVTRCRWDVNDPLAHTFNLLICKDGRSIVNDSMLMRFCREPLGGVDKVSSNRPFYYVVFAPNFTILDENHFFV